MKLTDEDQEGATVTARSDRSIGDGEVGFAHTQDNQKQIGQI
jgi:hypothetical protein